MDAPNSRIYHVQGFPFPRSERFPPKNIESALNFEPREGDVFVATYPKCGTTWVLYMIHELLYGSEKPIPTMCEIERIMPFLESSGAEAAMSLSSPRVIKTHLPYHLTPKSPLAKYISIIRNPYDVAVSYFHFLKDLTGLDLPLDNFVQNFISNNVGYGDCLDHELSWIERRNDPNVLLLSYDKMSLDPRKGLFKIARFLGDEYFNLLNDDEGLVKKILKRTSFDFMKKHLITSTNFCMKLAGEPQDGEDLVNFFRKGTVGDYKDHLTQELVEKMDIWVARKTEGTGIEKFWRV